MGVDGWVFFACAVLLALGYAGRFMLGESHEQTLIPIVGWVVAIVSLIYAALYVIGDDKGRNWVGSFLPFLFAFCALRLALW